MTEHQLTQRPDGQWQCRVCQWTWKQRPAMACPGVPRYEWGAWPEHAKTVNQLRQMHLKPQGAPIGCYYRASRNTKPDRWLWLYDVRTAVPTHRNRETTT